MTNLITLIIGLPGSGKTELGRIMIEDGAVLVDDPTSMVEIDDHGDADHIVITDPQLCILELREYAISQLEQMFPEVEIKTIFFENNPDQCQINADTRPNKKVKNFIRLLSPIYEIPEGAHVVPVWKAPG